MNAARSATKLGSLFLFAGLLAGLLALGVFSGAARAQCGTHAPDNCRESEGIRLSTGQIIYVPAYSSVFFGNKERQFLLAVTISIRNTDMQYPLIIKEVDYYDTKGNLLINYTQEPLSVGPLESYQYTIPENDELGGIGANFIVKWHSQRPINPPIVESVMIGTKSKQGISFTSRGQVVVEHD